MRCRLLLTDVHVVCVSVCHAAQLGFAVQGSFGAAFAKLLWPFVFHFFLFSHLCCLMLVMVMAPSYWILFKFFIFIYGILCNLSDSSLAAGETLLMPADVNSVTTNNCRQLEVSCCCCAGVLRFRMLGVWGRLEPVAISGSPS